MQDNLDVGVTSVGLSMPSAFVVSNSPVTASGNITVTGAGTVSQYIRGDGSLADFPQSGGGGGASVNYYLNGSVSQGTIGGIAYYEMNRTPILGAGTNFTIAADGYIASFITDAGNPGLLEIPGGNWNLETYFAASSGGGSPSFYVELYKVDSGGTATLVASNSANPELIAFGTTTTAYFSSLAVPTTVLTLTDRLALRYYVTHAGRTITMHTENSNLCQIITTFTTGLTALNGLTAQVQNFATGTTGTDFNISSSVSTHTFNIPSASATARGLVTTGTQTIAGSKTFSSDIVVNGVNVGRGAGSISTNTRLGSSALTSNTTGTSNTAVGDLSLQYNTTGYSNTALGRAALRNCVDGFMNTAVGAALNDLTSGAYNTAIGHQSALNTTTGNGNNSLGTYSLQSNTTGSFNTAIGFYSLHLNTTASNNTAIGVETLRNNTTGSQNTANGYAALQNNTTGSQNTAVGVVSLRDNTTGNQNTAIGILSLSENTTGNSNSAVGYAALTNNSTGFANAALGLESLTQNTTGYQNTAAGVQSLNSNTVGNNNTAIGNRSLFENTDGDENTAIGINCLYSNTTGNQNTAIGFNAGALTNSGSNNTTSSNSVYIGQDTRVSASGNINEIVIGSSARGNGSNTVTIGNSSITNNYFTGNIRGGAFIRTGGTSSQFLKADGSVDSSTYLTTGSAASTYLPLTGGILTGGIALTSGNLEIAAGNGAILFNPANSQYFQLYTNSSNELNFGYGGTSPVVAKIGSSGAVTLTGALNGTSASFTGDITLSAGGTNKGIYYTNTYGSTIVTNALNDNSYITGALRGEALLLSGTASKGLRIGNTTDNISYLSFTSTGAATFSSSVTATSETTDSSMIQQWGYNGNTATYRLRLNTIVSSGLVKYSFDSLNAGTAYNNNLVLDRGNVGIGTPSPAVKFEVAGSGSLGYFRNPSSTPATTFLTVLNANNTSNGLVMAHISDGTGYFGTQNNADLRFCTNDTERMRITSGGDLLLKGRSTTTNYEASFYNDNSQLAINANNTNVGKTINFNVRNDATAMSITSGGSVKIGQSYMDYPLNIEAFAGGSQLALTRSGAVTEMFMGGSTGAGTQFFVRSGGSGGVRLDTGATSWASASDLRLKDIEKPIENAVESLSTLQTVYYSWKDSEDKSLHLGLIAQEVEEVYPELVSESSIDETKAVKYTELIPVLVAAIKELKAEIESLKSQING
jgi:hypothetical protein